MTVDSISEGRLRLVYPDVGTRWRRVAEDFSNLHGKQLRVAQGMRTYAQQLEIWKQGRTLVRGVWQLTDPIHHTGVVTYAQPGDSWHHFSAVDSCFIGDDPWLEKDPKCDFYWSEYARLGKAHGFTAGYDWQGKKQDRPHLEMTYGMNLTDVKAIYADKGLSGVWAQFDQIRGVKQGSEWDSILSRSVLVNPEGLQK